MQLTFNSKCSTIGGFFDWCAQQYSGLTALIHHHQEWSFRRLAEEIDQMARALLGIGVRAGDRICLWMANRPSWIATQFAVAKIGAILVPINTRYKSGELAYVLKNVEPKALLMMDRFLNIDYAEIACQAVRDISLMGKGFLKDMTIIVQSCQSRAPSSGTAVEPINQLREQVGDVIAYHELAGIAAGVPMSEVLTRQQAVDPEDVSCIIFTSGTTSFSKGVMLGHRQIVEHGFKIGNHHDFDPGDRLIAVLPLFGSFMCVNAVFASFSHGTGLILQERFDAKETLRLFEAHRATAIYAVETILQDLFRHPDFATTDLSSWTKGQAAPVNPATLQRLFKEVGVAGLQNGYGMTETCAVATLTKAGDPYEKRIFTHGRPIEGVEVRIVDLESGKTCPPGQIGEIVVRGPNVTRGYYQMPEETAKALIDGWLYTGDLGVMDSDGYLTYKGRKKEMIKPGGFNVSALELENFLEQIPGVLEAAVIGIPDQRLGEAVVAFIRPAGSVADLSPDTIRDYAKRRIANYKVPKHVLIVEDFPRTPTGKIQKNKLRESLSGLGAADCRPHV